METRAVNNSSNIETEKLTHENMAKIGDCQSEFNSRLCGRVMKNSFGYVFGAISDCLQKNIVRYYMFKEK